MPKIINVPRNKLPPRLEHPRVAVSRPARTAHPHGRQTGDWSGAALRQFKRSSSRFRRHTLFAEGFKALLKTARVQRVEVAPQNLLVVTA